MYVCLEGLTPLDAEFACVIILLLELIACDTTLYILSLNGNASYLSDNIIYMRGLLLTTQAPKGEGGGGSSLLYIYIAYWVILQKCPQFPQVG